MENGELPKPRSIVRINEDQYIPRVLEYPIYISPEVVSDEELPQVESELAFLVGNFFVYRYLRNARENLERVEILRRDQLKSDGKIFLRNLFSILHSRLT